MHRTTVGILGGLIAWCVCAAVWAQDQPIPADGILGDPAVEEPVLEEPLGDPPAGESPPSQEVSALAAEQAELAERFHSFEQILLRMAEITEATDPRQAALLRRAVSQSKDRLIGRQFDELVALMNDAELARAIESQSALHGDLQALLTLLLSENREKRIESEKARLRDYLKRLSRIIGEQKSLQGRTGGDDDPAQLAQDQGKLAEKTGELSDDVREADEAADPADSAEAEPSPGGKGEPGEGPLPAVPADPGSEEPESGKPAANPGNAENPQEEPSKAPPDPASPPNPPAPSQGTPPPSGQSEPGQRGQQGHQQEQEGQPGQEGQSQQGQPSPSEPGKKADSQNPARVRLDAARKRMDAAQKRLEEAKRADAVKEQEEAIRELEEAKAELEAILRQLREEEIERMLARLESRFRHMLDLQREVYEGTQRLDGVPAAERTPSHTIDAGRLASREAEILSEADRARLLLQEDGTAVAFPEAVDQMRADMAQIHQRLTAADVGKMTQAVEEDVIAALEEMIEALVRAQKEMQNQEQQPPPDQQGQPQDEPLVDSLAELKMIRALQVRVNRRTDRYVELLQSADANTPELLEALDRLAERQQRIYRITRDLHLGRNR